MVTYEVDEAEALRAVFGKGADIGFDTLVDGAGRAGGASGHEGDSTYAATVAGADAAALFLDDRLPAGRTAAGWAGGGRGDGPAD